MRWAQPLLSSPVWLWPGSVSAATRSKGCFMLFPVDSSTLVLHHLRVAEEIESSCRDEQSSPPLLTLVLCCVYVQVDECTMGLYLWPPEGTAGVLEPIPLPLRGSKQKVRLPKVTIIPEQTGAAVVPAAGESTQGDRASAAIVVTAVPGNTAAVAETADAATPATTAAAAGAEASAAIAGLASSSPPLPPAAPASRRAMARVVLRVQLPEARVPAGGHMEQPPRKRKRRKDPAAPVVPAAPAAPAAPVVQAAPAAPVVQAAPAAPVVQAAPAAPVVPAAPAAPEAPVVPGAARDFSTSLPQPPWLPKNCWFSKDVAARAGTEAVARAAGVDSWGHLAGVGLDQVHSKVGLLLPRGSQVGAGWAETSHLFGWREAYSRSGSGGERC